MQLTWSLIANWFWWLLGRRRAIRCVADWLWHGRRLRSRCIKCGQWRGICFRMAGLRRRFARIWRQNDVLCAWHRRNSDGIACARLFHRNLIVFHRKLVFTCANGKINWSTMGIRATSFFAQGCFRSNANARLKLLTSKLFVVCMHRLCWLLAASGETNSALRAESLLWVQRTGYARRLHSTILFIHFCLQLFAWNG